MERSTSLDPKLKELQILREEMVLAIRKAFNFESLPTSSLALGKHQDKGFGFIMKAVPHAYILAYPDIVTKRIRVTFRLPDFAEEEVCYIDCGSGMSEAGEELKSMVIGFLANIILHETGEEIRW